MQKNQARQTVFEHLIPQEAFDWHDEYAHGIIDRRTFMGRLSTLTATGLLMGTRLAALMPDYALAEQVSFNDPDIKARSLSNSPNWTSGSMPTRPTMRRISRLTTWITRCTCTPRPTTASTTTRQVDVMRRTLSWHESAPCHSSKSTSAKSGVRFCIPEIRAWSYGYSHQIF